MKQVTIKAPARICLFGDHQDYLKLPVIACAIDRSLLLSAVANDSGNFNFNMPDIGQERTFAIDDTFVKLAPQDFLASALRVVKRYGCHPNKGYNIHIKSSIPINAGISSSSALTVAWVHFLLQSFGCDREITSQFIGQLAYEAEVVEHHSPGGKMDQYTIAIGGMVYIDTSDDFSVTPINTVLKGLVLGESGVPKETIGVLGDLRKKAQDAIKFVQDAVPNFRLHHTNLNQLEQFLPHIPHRLQPFFYAAVKNHDITKQAFIELKKTSPNLETIGQLITVHHLVLKDTLKITVPKIDQMVTAALKAGAYGAKIVGSGGGGSIVALAPTQKLQAVIEAIKSAGAKDAYSVSITKGTQLI